MPDIVAITMNPALDIATDTEAVIQTSKVRCTPAREINAPRRYSAPICWYSQARAKAHKRSACRRPMPRTSAAC